MVPRPDSKNKRPILDFYFILLSPWLLEKGLRLAWVPKDQVTVALGINYFIDIATLNQLHPLISLKVIMAIGDIISYQLDKYIVASHLPRGSVVRRTDKMEGSVLWSSHHARSLQPARGVRTGFCTATSTERATTRPNSERRPHSRAYVATIGSFIHKN